MPPELRRVSGGWKIWQGRRARSPTRAVTLIDYTLNGAKERRRHEIKWLFIVLIVWALLDLTLDASITSMLVCLRFGWNDWLSSRWLRKRDPLRTRAACCAWFYLSSAFWKVAAASVAAMFLLLIIETVLFGRQEPGRDWLLMACESGVAFILAVLLTTWGAITAWWHAHRIWVNAEVSRSRLVDLWPPFGPMQDNAVSKLVTMALIVWFVPLSIVTIVIAFSAVPRQTEGWATIVSMGGMIGSAVILLMLRNFICRRVAAQSPHGCWPEVPESWFAEPKI